MVQKMFSSRQVSEMQGLKPAGQAFYCLLVAILAKKDIHPTSIDAGFFFFDIKAALVFMRCETNDFLMATNSEKAYKMIKDTIEEAFRITLQRGPCFSYLNFRIIQSTHGISIDQTGHILHFLKIFFNSTAKVARTDTVIRTDKQFNNEIAFDIPASASELK